MSTVLIVDDNENILFVLVRILAHFRPDYQFITARSGTIAWEQCQQHPPDLLWTDYEMEDINGLELARRVRNIAPNLPIVLMTGGGADIQKEIQALNRVSYLAKPFTNNQILNLIETLGL